jgi:polysaccharide export outer membrane protein
MSVKVLATIVLVLIVSLSAAQTPVSPVPASSAEETGNSVTLKTRNLPEEQEVKIGSGDLLELSMYGVPEFSSQGRVSSSGDLTIPVLGTVRLAGLTAAQAQDHIREELMKKKLYTDPHISVAIKEYATQGVSVMGEVNKPGVYPRMGPQRLLDMISAAGGTTPKAGSEVTVVHRDEPDKPRTLQLSNDPSKALASNAQIMPGDTIIVSRAGIIYVIGEVTKPGGFVMDNDGALSVVQAVALAGGATHTAALGNARLIRRSQGTLQEIPIPLQKILHAKGEDLAMRNGDILFVPNSAWKSASRRGMEAILQTAVGVAIYHP